MILCLGLVDLVDRCAKAILKLSVAFGMVGLLLRFMHTAFSMQTRRAVCCRERSHVTVFGENCNPHLSEFKIAPIYSMLKKFPSI